QAQVALRRLARDGRLEPERALEALRGIASQTDKLNCLLSHLLDISRLEAGKLALDRQGTDLVELIGQVVANGRSREAAVPIELDAPAALEAMVDPLRLEQVLTNLLDNALKFSPEGSPIEVTLQRASGDGIEIAVRDHGPGIPPERRERI